MKKLKVRVGQGPAFTLSDKDFLASGGEGSIYLHGSDVVKIYSDPSKGPQGIAGKIVDLSKLNHKGIISPNGIVFDHDSGAILGFSMPKIDGEPLVRYFSNEFRKANGFGIKESVSVASDMKDIVSYAHSHRALVVDGNEMNYLVGKNQEVKAIDVDSWQIGPYKATAIMLSIRDPHSKQFTELTDWYSWGIVTFSLFTGIHPYRGKHPKYNAGEMVQRMTANVSVFDKAVIVPSSVRPFTDIPNNLLAWYEAVFRDGNRLPPPDQFQTVTAPKVQQKTVYTGGGTIKLVKLREFDQDIVQVLENEVVITRDYIYLPGVKEPVWKADLGFKNHRYGMHVVSTIRGYVVVEETKQTAAIIKPHEAPVFLTVSDQKGFTPYLSTKTRLIQFLREGVVKELVLQKIGDRYMFIPALTWAVSYNATKLYDGVGFMDAFGTPCIVLPVSDEKSSGLIVKAVPALSKKKIIHAKAINNFAVCLVKDGVGQDFKMEMFYEHSHALPKEWMAPTDESDLNFTINNKGVVATIPEDGRLVLFMPSNGKVREVKDKTITETMRLCQYAGQTAFVKDNEIWAIST